MRRKNRILSVLGKLESCLDDLKVFCPTGPGGGIDSSCSPGKGGFDPSRPSRATVHYEDEDDTHVVEKTIFGRNLNDQEIASMIGAPDDARVTVSYDTPNSLRLLATNKYVNMERVVYKNERTGEVSMMNEFFRIQASEKSQGLGTRLFARQVYHAAKVGVDKINTNAVGRKNTSYNGYYTWARLGYDGNIPTSVLVKNPPDDARRVSDLMKSEKGRRWWRDNGDEFIGTFDLKSGSSSRKVLDDYVKEKFE